MSLSTNILSGFELFFYLPTKILMKIKATKHKLNIYHFKFVFFSVLKQSILLAKV